jgi:hypothetical protein
MTQQEWLVDRWALLAEVAAIEVDLVRFEQRHGTGADELRQRIAAVRTNVIGQLLAAARLPETVH